MAKLHPELKAKWIAALRSDDYKQTKGVLCSTKNGERAFCCLGVLTDILIKENQLSLTWNFNSEYFATASNANDSAAIALHPSIRKITGLSPNGKLPKPHDNSALAHLNDNGYSFRQIADVIEKHF
jgi:hypothetical protein